MMLRVNSKAAKARTAQKTVQKTAWTAVSVKEATIVSAVAAIMATVVATMVAAEEAMAVSRVAIDRRAATTAMTDNEQKTMGTNQNHRNRSRVANKFAAILLVASFGLLTTMCSPGGAFDSDFKTIDTNGWSKSSPLVFLQPDSVRGVKVYDIAVDVRHDNDYPYRNLSLVIDYLSGRKVVAHDTVSIELCDKYGDWGGSGLGKYFQKQQIVKRGVRLGDYDRIVVWHNMRCDKVTNVSDIGLTYFKAD